MGPVVTGEHRRKIVGYIDARRRAGRDARRRRPRASSSPATSGLLPRPDAVRSRDAGDDDLQGRNLRAGADRRARRDRSTRRSRWSTPTRTATAPRSSRDRARRRGASSRRSQVGMVGINVPIPVPMAFFSFGGWKQSLFGDLHVHGTEGIKFYTRTKAVTRRWTADARQRSVPHAAARLARHISVSISARRHKKVARRSLTTLHSSYTT